MGSVKSLNRDQLLDMMRKRQGERTAKDFAEELGISPQYLSDIYSEKREPGPSVLEALCLSRDIVYKPLAEAEGLR